MKIIGYTYEADVHCPACTHKRFNALDNGSPGCIQTWHEDEHGVPLESVDIEGNTIHPVFDIDENNFTH